MIEIKDELDTINFPSEAEDPLVIEISSDNEAMFDLVLYAPTEESSISLLKQQARIIKDRLGNYGAISSIDIQ
jgi:multidrug efflux pump subunit AcrB